MKNPFNLENPLLQYAREATLKNGNKVLVKGQVFDHSIVDQGDVVHSMVALCSPTSVVIGVRFYRLQMNREEIEAEVENICENPDYYLMPDALAQMNN